MNDSPRLSFFFRKLLHITAGLIFVFLYLHYSEHMIFLTTVTLLVFILDISRKISVGWNELFLKFFGKMLKVEESRGKTTGAATLFIGLYLVTLLFSESIFVQSAGIIVLADPLAALGGKFLKSPAVIGKKTLAGSAIFFLTSFVFLLWYGNIPLIPVIIIVIILTLIELLIHGSWENVYLAVGSAILFDLYQRILL